MGDNSPPTGPDFKQGIASSDLKQVLLGQADGEAVLLVRRNAKVYAIGGKCSHYSSSMVDGLIEGDTIRCPWHHACFDLKTGEALEGPAFNPLPCWDVQEKDGRITLFEKKRFEKPKLPTAGPTSVVIVGAGAAGESAAEELRRRGYEGPVTMIDADADTPIDRPNLSKDNLAGTAPEDWLWLHPADWYGEQRITRKTAKVTSVDAKARKVSFEDGTSLEYGALVLATGASAIRPKLEGNGPPVFVVRSVSDLRGIVKAAEGKKRTVVIGGSFIGLEVASSLRARGLEVQVVAPDAAPLAKIVGPELAAVVKRLHEEKGVRFHLGRRATGLSPNGVVLDDGSVVEGELVVAGVGVKPNLSLAEGAGLAMDRGVKVDEAMRTTDANIWAIGDIARFPGRYGEAQRIEHWAVAQNQGRVAARNVLGLATRFTTAPFFWSQHYDVTLSYVGHAESWDRIELTGDPQKLDCTVRYWKGHRLLAVATLGRDRVSMQVHETMTREATWVQRAKVAPDVLKEARGGERFGAATVHGLSLEAFSGARPGEHVWLVAANAKGETQWAQRLSASFMMAIDVKIEADGDGFFVRVGGEHARGGEMTSWDFVLSAGGDLWSATP
ncbi:MAG: FAD-dependent oxidoreductase [Myxococcaceae bacterium]